MVCSSYIVGLVLGHNILLLCFIMDPLVVELHLISKGFLTPETSSSTEVKIAFLYIYFCLEFYEFILNYFACIDISCAKVKLFPPLRGV